MRSLVCTLFVIGLITACATTKKPGDSCRAGPSTCVDATSVGTCRAFTWHVDPCRGPAGCGSGTCDQSVALKDDTCGTLGLEACSLDGKELLRCDGANMVVQQACRGEHGCHRENGTPQCDVGPPQIGDACTATMGSRCSADGKQILQCSQQTHHMVLERDCLGPKGCFKNPHFHDGGMEFLACDISAGEIGKPCIGYAGVGMRIENGGEYCSTDGTELLTCKSGVYAAKTACSCTVRWDQDLAAYGVGCESNSRGYRSAAFLSLAERK